MKTLSSHRISERERRYPFCAACDATVHWLLCASLAVCVALLFGFIVVKNTPQLSKQATDIYSKIRG